jgi:hypothetical protein
MVGGVLSAAFGLAAGTSVLEELLQAARKHPARSKRLSLFMFAKIRVKKLAIFKKNVLLYRVLSNEQGPLHRTTMHLLHGFCSTYFVRISFLKANPLFLSAVADRSIIYLSEPAICPSRLIFQAYVPVMRKRDEFFGHR